MNDGEQMKLRVVSLTDVGLDRENNEDCSGYFEDDDGARGSLLVVADGMGGALGGEVASRTAVDVVEKTFRDRAAGVTPPERVRLALERANAAINEMTVSDPRLAGMGTTCTAALIIGPMVFLGHVGDSRAYLVRDGSITQLTEDHTLAAEAQRSAPNAASQNVPRHLLTRALGPQATIAVDVIEAETPLQEGDVLLLCSDGLTGQVRNEEILDVVKTGNTPEAICRSLVKLALERGGPDNITVVAARVDPD